MTIERSLRARLAALALGAMASVCAGAMAGGAMAQGGYGHPEGHGSSGGRGGGYERPQGAPRGNEGDRRGGPGPGYYGPTAPYGPPRYAAPPPRPYGAEPGWRPAPIAPPGFHGARTASLGWVLESIDRRTPGRVLDAHIEDMGGRPVYRVLWLTVHGRRMEYSVDAATGAVLSGR